MKYDDLIIRKKGGKLVGDLVYFPTKGKCVVCGAETKWINIVYGAFVCSTECNEKKLDEITGFVLQLKQAIKIVKQEVKVNG